MKAEEVTVKGVTYRSISAAAEALNVSLPTVLQRLNALPRFPTPEQIDRCFSKKRMAYRGNFTVVEGRAYISLKEAAAHYGLPGRTAQSRIRRLPKNHTPAQFDACFTEPVRHNQPRKRGKGVTVRGQSFKSISDAARHFNVDPKKAQRRVRELPKGHNQDAFDQCFDAADRANTAQGKPLIIAGTAYTGLMDACRAYKIDYSFIKKRLQRNPRLRQAEIDALFAAGNASKDNRPTAPKAITVYGVLYRSIRKASEAHGLGKSTINARVKKLNLETATADEINACFSKDPA